MPVFLAMEATPTPLEPVPWRLDALSSGCAAALAALLIGAARCLRWPPESPVGWTLEAHPGRATAALALVLLAIAPAAWWSRGRVPAPKIRHRGPESPSRGSRGALDAL